MTATVLLRDEPRTTQPLVSTKRGTRPIGAVSGAYAGGLTGYGGAASNSYWNSTTSGQATGPGGTGKTTGEMQTASTYSGWDTSTIWNIADGSYPTLK